MKRRDFLKTAVLAAGGLALSGLPENPAIAADRPQAPQVWHWQECSVENLLKALGKVRSQLSGKIAVKLHSGEPQGPNIIPPAWAEAVVRALPQATAVECNVLYPSPRKTTAGHRAALQANGWNIPVDILDEEGDAFLPISNGLHLTELAVGKNLLNYDSLLVLTHFKGHAMGGFGGSLKNIAIGCASGKLGKKQVHGVLRPDNADVPTSQWPGGAYFMELMADAGKAITEHFKGRYACINVLRRMSVDCDCAGTGAAAPVTPDLGILASTDILAIDQASIDLVYALPETHKKALVQRIESRTGLRQLSAMQELGMGSRTCRLVEESA